MEEASPGFRLRKIDEIRSYLLDEMKHNDLMSEKYKKSCKYIIYVEHLLILVSAITGYLLISAFASLVAAPVGVMISEVAIKICAITAGLKKYKPIIKKKKKKHDKIVSSRKFKLNTIEVLNFKALIDSYISHEEFVSVNNALRGYNEMKKEIKNPETFKEYFI